MKKLILPVILTAVLVMASWKPRQDFSLACTQVFKQKVTRFITCVTQLQQRAEKKDSLAIGWRIDLLTTKLAWKEIEFLAEYYFPATSRYINGAPIAQADEDEGTQQIFEPEGLQVIEEYIYEDSVYVSLHQLSQPVQRLVQHVRRLPYLLQTSSLGEWQIMDAMQQEIVRVFTMGICGFDTPASGQELQQSYTALQSLIPYLQLATQRKEAANIIKKIQRNLLYLKANFDHSDFNRFVFIRDYALPLHTAFRKYIAECYTESKTFPSVFLPNAYNVFDERALNPAFYDAYHTKFANTAVAEKLGELLFYDVALSDNQTLSCASCHNPRQAFTDGLTTSRGNHGTQLTRNAPTLIDAALQASYFWDARTASLEEQARQVAFNSNELHTNFTQAIKIISAEKTYSGLFSAAFTGSDTLVSALSILKAIAAYERTLISFNSKFDRNIRGEEKTFTAEETEGFNLFTGKALCATCHFMPFFNGTVPPGYTKTETEIIGVPNHSNLNSPVPDTDEGKFSYSGLNLHKGAFKTPGLRNCAVTAPYMHNGVFASLEEVIEFYDRGGGAGIGLTVTHQTLPFDNLQLTPNEKKALVAFMHTLTDTTGMPVHINKPSY